MSNCEFCGLFSAQPTSCWKAEMHHCNVVMSTVSWIAQSFLGLIPTDVLPLDPTSLRGALDDGVAPSALFLYFSLNSDFAPRKIPAFGHVLVFHYANLSESKATTAFPFTTFYALNYSLLKCWSGKLQESWYIKIIQKPFKWQYYIYHRLLTA